MTELVRVGNKDVQLRADGATPFLYKQAFGKDLLKIFSEASGTDDAAVVSDLASELGFVMAQQAKSPDPLKVDLSRGAFMGWLVEFEPLDLTNAAMDIVNVYLGTYNTDSIAKKKEEHLTEN